MAAKKTTKPRAKTTKPRAKTTAKATAKATRWGSTKFGIEPVRVVAAYREIRGAIATDPLFVKDAEEFGVSLDDLDARMTEANVPSRLEVDGALWTWLEGADQYRYAGLAVLARAYPAPSLAFHLHGRVTVPDEATIVHAGNVTIDGDLLVGTQSMILITGDLVVTGNIIGESFDFSMIAARSVRCAGGMTSGEIIALDRIVASGAFYFAGNDYSSRAPLYEGNVLVDFERGNVFTKTKVKKRITEWSFEAAAKALGITNKKDDDDLVATFRATLG